MSESEFDKLKGDAEQAAKDHPQQVQEGEQDAEKEGRDLLSKESGGQNDGESRDENRS